MEYELWLLQQILEIAELKIVSAKIVEGMIVLQCELLLKAGVCRECRTVSRQIVRYVPRELRHLKILQRVCVLNFNEHEYECPRCGKTWVGPLGFAEAYSPYTIAYEEHVWELAKGQDLKRVAELEGLPTKTVENLYYRVAARKQKARIARLVRAVGIDEISVKKGHGNYRALIYDLDEGRVLEVLENREKATVEAYFRGLPEGVRKAIRVISIDMWETNRAAIEELIGEGTLREDLELVADKFHVIKQLNERMNEARRKIQREESPQTRETLKGIRWPLVKDRKRLDREERAKLRSALEVSKALGRLYAFKCEFLEIYRLRKRGRAKRRLQDWLRRAEGSGIEALQKFCATVRNWQKEILAYFNTRITSATCEGLNNKVKLIKRRGFGYRNHAHFRARILHACG